MRRVGREARQTGKVGNAVDSEYYVERTWRLEYLVTASLKLGQEGTTGKAAGCRVPAAACVPSQPLVGSVGVMQAWDILIVRVLSAEVQVHYWQSYGMASSCVCHRAIAIELPHGRGTAAYLLLPLPPNLCRAL